MQQQKATEPVQPQNNNVQRGPFPWERVIRIIVAVSMILILSILTIVGLFVTGHMYNASFSVPAAIGLILAIIAVLAWLFPFRPFGWQQFPPSLPVPTGPTAKTDEMQTTPPITQIVQVFHLAKSQLPSPDEFYGRAYERATLINCISQRSSTALVGESWIGKSWLIQYLQQIAPTHAQLGPQVHIGELNVAHPLCYTQADFVKEALKALHLPQPRLNPHDKPLAYLSLKVRKMKKQGITPVLCINEFTSLIDKPDFDRRFLNELRAIAQHDKLVLIIVSRKPLHKLIEQMTGGTSPLFNIMPELTLQPFTEAEAQVFIHEKGQQSSLSGDEQTFFRECAAISQANGKLGWPPLRLQLTGQLLLRDKSSGTLALNDPDYGADFKKRLDE